MWQRFTERARRAVFFAQEEAGRLGKTEISTEHLLLGLLREKEDAAVILLGGMGVSLESVRAEAERLIGHEKEPLGFNLKKRRNDMQLSRRGKQAIDLAYDEARLLHNNYIGSEHLLLGLLRESEERLKEVAIGGAVVYMLLGLIREFEGGGGQALLNLGVGLEQTRRQVRLLQNSDSGGAAVDSDAEPGLAFAQRYAALSAEHRAALEGDGASLNLLPEAMRQTIQSLFEQSGAAEHVIVDPNATIRVYIQRIATDARPNAACRYIVTAQATFVTNFLVRDASAANAACKRFETASVLL